MNTLRKMSTENLIRLRADIETVLQQRADEHRHVDMYYQKLQAFEQWADDHGVKIQFEVWKEDKLFFAKIEARYPRGNRLFDHGVSSVRYKAIENAINTFCKHKRVYLDDIPVEERPYASFETRGEPGDAGDSLYQPWLTEAFLDDEIEMYMYEDEYF